MLPHPLTNFEIQKYYGNEFKFNSVHARKNLPNTKTGAYVINVFIYYIKYIYITYYIYILYIFIYFDSFGVEHISKEIKIFIRKTL